MALVSFQETQIKRIFGSMINQKLQDFEEEVKPIGDIMTQATIEMYEAVVQKFLPTPTKIHYLFNLRDISKVSLWFFLHEEFIVTNTFIFLFSIFFFSIWIFDKEIIFFQIFQGLLRAHKDFHDTKHAMTRLWIHECFR